MVAKARYQDLRDRVLGANDFVHAEPVRLSFLASGVADPSRPRVDIEAILRVGEGGRTNVGGQAARNWRTRIVAGKAELHINRATYTGPMPRQGDKVKALARVGEPWFEVLGVDDRSHTRLVLQLGEA